MLKFKMLGKLCLKFFICQKPNHFIKDCPKREDNEYFVHIGFASDKDSYDAASALVWCQV